MGATRAWARWCRAQLGWGRLTGKVRRGQPLPARSRLHTTAELGPPVEDEYPFGVVDALEEIANETGKVLPQVAINWLLQRLPYAPKPRNSR